MDKKILLAKVIEKLAKKDIDPELLFLVNKSILHSYAAETQWKEKLTPADNKNLQKHHNLAHDYWVKAEQKFSEGLAMGVYKKLNKENANELKTKSKKLKPEYVPYKDGEIA